jgi:integrase
VRVRPRLSPKVDSEAHRSVSTFDEGGPDKNPALERRGRGEIAKSTREATRKKGSKMNEKPHYQKGYVWKVGRAWHGRWYRDELVPASDLTDKERQHFAKKNGALPDDGSRVLVRRQHSEKLVEVSDRFRTKRDVQILLSEKLSGENNNRADAKSTLSVAAYVREFFFPSCEKEMKPSTVNGYKGVFKTYLRARLENLSLRDARCMHITNIIADIHREHGLSRRSLRGCKGFLGSVFKQANSDGVLDQINPCLGARIPKAALAGKPTHAYSLEEVFAMLDALEGVARRAVALTFFCGLRPGEAKAARWENYDGKTFTVCQSAWRLHLTDPKTEESKAPVPVPEPLREILEESKRASGYILESATGRRVHFENLYCRVIRGVLARCAECRGEKASHDSADHEFKPLPVWHGWYAFRRGWATLATSIDSDLAAKSLLRHSNIATTRAHYIKSVPADALRAVDRINALCERSTNEVPN